MKLWKEYERECVLYSKQKYEEYIGSKRKASFIRFRNLQAATKPIPLKNLLLFFGVKRLSRKGFYVDKETANDLIEQMGCKK